MKQKTGTYEVLSVFFHDISLMIASGTDTEEMLDVLSSDCLDEGLGSALEQMRGAVSGGGSLSNAMRQTAFFPDYAVTMLGAAEQTGKIEDVTLALSVYYRRRAGLQKQISAALEQPLALLFTLSLVMAGFVCAILPSLSGLYEALGGDAGIYVSGAYFIAYTAFAIMFVGMVTALVIWAGSRTSGGRSRLDKMWQNSPWTREAAMLSAQAHMMSDLEVRMSGGELPELAFEQAGNTSHPKLHALMQKCTQRLHEGEGIGDVILKEKLLPPVCAHILFCAQRNGKMDSALSTVCELLLEQAQKRVELLIGRIEPVLTGFFTVSVGFSLLSVMLPLIGIITAMG